MDGRKTVSIMIYDISAKLYVAKLSSAKLYGAKLSGAKLSYNAG